MADRFWVGGSGLWDGNNTAQWSDVTGGTGGFSVPTSSDNVYFDANSGNSTSVIEVQRPGGVPCFNFSTVGFVGTIGTQTSSSNQRRINIYGNCTLGSNGIFASALLPSVYFQGAAGVTQQITCNGQDMGNVNFNGTATTTYKFMDSFYAVDLQNEIVTHTQGIIDANNQNVFIERIQFGNPTVPASAVRTVNMGSGTWTIYGGTSGGGQIVWDARDSVNLTINASTSIIYLNNASGVTRTFYTGGQSYNKLLLGAPAGGGGLNYIYGGGSFNEVASNKQAYMSVYFESGITTNVNLFSACGNYNNPDWAGPLLSSINSTQTTGITLAAYPTNYPSYGTIRIGNEVISFTGIVDNGNGWEYTGVTRGANGSSNANHNALDTIYTAYYLQVYATTVGSQATITTKTPSGVFYAGANSINSGNNTGITFSSGYIIDYSYFQDMLFVTTRSVSPTVGYSGVANQIQTTPGNALGVVGNASAGLGNDVAGAGVVDLYTGVS
jgi:hypothetical protein